MKTIYTLAVFTSIVLASCAPKEIESVFDSSPEKRAQKVTEELKAGLTNATHGWTATYEYGAPTNTVFMNISFGKDDSVFYRFPINENEVNSQKSTYSLNYSQQVNLQFNSQTFFSSTANLGMLGDFIFELEKQEKGTYVFKGRGKGENASHCSLVLKEAQPNEKIPHPEIKSERVTLMTAGRTRINSVTAAGEGLWIDLNNNAQYDDGEEMRVLTGTMYRLPSGQVVRLYMLEVPKEMQQIKIYGKKISFMEYKAGNLVSIDLTKAPHLSRLDCYSNNLTDIDLTKNPELVYLDLGRNKLTNIDITQNPNLRFLHCIRNQLTSLNFTQNPKLEILELNRNQLTSLDLSQKNNLKIIRCNDNRLASLDIGQNPSIEELEFANNQVTILDVTQKPKLRILNCNNNSIGSLDVTKNKNLLGLYCSGCNLTSLDITQNPGLNFLVCSNNSLTNIDISEKPHLRVLECDRNRLSYLDVTKNPLLLQLYCSSNQLVTLDLSQNTAMYVLECTNNQLTDLDLSKNNVLTRVYCENNQLTTLKLATLEDTAFGALRCYNNRIKADVMVKLVESLPQRVSSPYGKRFIAIDTQSTAEGNVCNREHVAIANERGWNVIDNATGEKYEGSPIAP